MELSSEFGVNFTDQHGAGQKTRFVQNLILIFRGGKVRFLHLEIRET
jgi:hypothetical protein